jgi:hypothetical protein
MKTILSLLFLAGVLAPSLAAQTDTTWHPPPPRIVRQPDVISLEEIQTTADAKDAYELVRRLRPQFLTVRATGTAGRTKPTDILVWVNGAERGSLETLRTIPAHAVLEIRKISAADAVTQYGKDQNGVILVRVATGYPPT